jgi:NADH/NAD ratio-sensing transcriptional regulator Rex
MVSRGPLAVQLSEFSQLHRRLVQVLGFLHREKASGVLTISSDELKQKVLDIQDIATRLDRQYFNEAEVVEPLFPES